MTPETPDFDQIAGTITFARPVVPQIFELLRQVWNARGAADANLFTGEMDDRDIHERIATLDR